jgi:RNA polymerase sigma factor (sigma-70 family)
VGASPASAAFTRACRKAEVADHVVPLLWALHVQRDDAGRPRWDVDALLADHAHWRQYVRSRAGDEESSRAFRTRWTAEIRAFAADRFPHQDSEDLAGQFFSRVYRLVGPDFAWTAPFCAYLRTVLITLARDLRAKTTRSRLREPSLEARREAGGWEPASDGPSPERHVLREEQAVAVRGALAELSPGDQFIVNACLVEGLAGNEVAGMLGIDRDAVYQRLHRARTRLKKRLAEQGAFAPPARARSARTRK